jgi:hypothetical protein
MNAGNDEHKKDAWIYTFEEWLQAYRCNPKYSYFIALLR